MWIVSILISLCCIDAERGKFHFEPRLTCARRSMTLMRMPLTVWAWFVTAILSLLAFCVLAAAGILLLLDRNFRHEFLSSGGPCCQRSGAGAQRGIATARAAPLLVLWSSGSVHRDSSRHGGGVPGAGEFFAEAGFRLSGDGACDMRDRISRIPRLGASHVCQRDEPVLKPDVFGADDVHWSTVCDKNLQLGRYNLGREKFSSRRPMLFAIGFVSLFVTGGLSRHFFLRSLRWTICFTRPITWSLIFTS